LDIFSVCPFMMKDSILPPGNMYVHT
jgi:hypothetical protein